MTTTSAQHIKVPGPSPGAKSIAETARGAGSVPPGEISFQRFQTKWSPAWTILVRFPDKAPFRKGVVAPAGSRAPHVRSLAAWFLHSSSAGAKPATRPSARVTPIYQTIFINLDDVSTITRH